MSRHAAALGVILCRSYKARSLAWWLRILSNRFTIESHSCFVDLDHLHIAIHYQNESVPDAMQRTPALVELCVYLAGKKDILLCPKLVQWPLVP